MALADWMVPQLSLSAELQVRHSVDTLQTKGADNIEETVKLACSLVQQNAIQQAIIRQATGYIAQLELQILLGNPAE
jgi:hypothetical protein